MRKLTEEVRERLRDRNINEVSRRTGLSADAIRKFLKGQRDPAYQTLATLVDYLGLKVEVVNG